jgi:hypothetical protein
MREMQGKGNGMGSRTVGIARRARIVRVSAWVAIAGSTACHNAKITRLDAMPRHVCPGDPVELAWAFDGAGTMTVAPPTAQAPAGRVGDRGTAVIRPATGTTVDLQVTRWGGEPAGGRLDIEIGRAETLAASLADPGAACHDGVVTSTAHVRNFDAGLSVLELDVPASHARAGYDVTHVDERTHQPVTAHVAPGAPATRFAGQPINGDWILSSPLAPGEACDSPGLPGNLAVIAYTQCAGGGGAP